MNNIKQHLLNIGLVEDTEYLDKYVELILANKEREYEIAKTQSHHIVPVFYYKELQIPVDNSEVNRVNLLYKDHLLAHYYLCCCCKLCYKPQSFMPLFIIWGHKNFPENEKAILYQLDNLQELYEQSRLNNKNVMFDDLIRKHHDDIMRTIEVRTKISDTMKNKVQNGELFTESHRKNLSLAASGKISINNGFEEKHIKKEYLDEYLNKGWKKGGLPVPKDLVEKRAKKRCISVYCVDEYENKLGTFNSVKSACEWWVDNGYTRKIPKNIYELSNVIKDSSKNDKYVCGIKWIYIPKERG